MTDELLDILVCPQTKKSLVLSQNKDMLISVMAKCAYPIRDGVPIMLLEEAIPLTDKKIKELTKNLEL